MKKGKELDNILDECLERMLTRGETIEQCLASYPEQAAELEPLLQTALFTREALAIKPRPEFRDRARYQLRAALREMEEKKERRFSLFSWQPRWATAVISVLILLLASSGTVAASGNSMPDEPLYPVKMAAERVQVAFTFSDFGKAELYARLADKRVTEIIKMADKGKAEQADRIATKLNDQLVSMAILVGAGDEEAGTLMVPAPPAATQEAPEPRVAEVTPEEKPAMLMAPAPPAEVEAPVAEEALEKHPGAVLAPTPPAAAEARPVPLVEPALPEESQAIPDGRAEPDKKDKLEEIVARNAAEHSAALRAALEKVPESARPALLRAIEVSDDEYKKVLKALRKGSRD